MNSLKNCFIITFLFLTSFHLFSQDSIRFYNTIDSLSSEYFYGRGYTNQGHIKVADYLKEIFRTADKLEKQPFDFTINQFYGEMELILDEDTLAPCYDYIPLPQASTGTGNLSIKVLDSVFFANQSLIDKFIKKKIGKCAVVYNSKFESKITDQPSLRRKIYLEAGAILNLTSGETLKSFALESWMPPAFSVKLEKFTNQKKIKFELKQKPQKITSNNIIATIKGTDSALKEMIICAHYDHVGGYKNCYIPGANDNATGTAMLIELFYYFSKNKPKRTIKFIAFAGEEVGLLGSSYYVNHANLENIVFVLNLDLYGGGSGGGTGVNGKIFEEQFLQLTTINATEKYVSKIKARGEAANSDHYYFSKNSVPAFFIYSNGDVGGYHNINDTPDKLERGYFNSLFMLLKDFTEGIVY